MIESGIFLNIVIILLKRSSNTPFQDRALLNRIFIIGIAGWFIYLLLDLLIFLIAPLSLDSSYVFGQYTGYHAEIPSLLIANILRDIGMVGALIFNMSIFIGAYYIRYGEEKTIKTFKNNWLVLILFLFFSGYLVYEEGIALNYKNSSTIVVQEIWFGRSGFFLIIILLQLCISIIFLIRTINKSKQNIQLSSDLLNKKIRMLIYGVLHILFGDIYWIILGVLHIPLESLFTSLYIRIIIFYAGHLLWIAAGLFLRLSFKTQSHLETK